METIEKHGKINVLDKEPNEEAEDKAWEKNRSQMNLKRHQARFGG